MISGYKLRDLRGNKLIIFPKIYSMRKLVFLCLIIFSVLSCKQNSVNYSTITGFAQGTTYSMVFENLNNLNPATVNEKVGNILHAFDMSLSGYIDSSLLCRINRNEDVVCDTFFTGNFLKSREIWQMSGGAFDVTVAPLVKAWGFGPDSHISMTDHKRDSILQFVGMEKVDLRNGKIIKTDPRISLDFNAIAQGYSVDVICHLFDNLGFGSYLIEIGGEVRVKGNKGGRPWQIGIDKPVDDNMVPGEDLEAIIKLTDKALATSGNYRKFYVENGVKYSHTIDPKSGNPARNTLLSASIIANDCATADGIATACMVMGMEKSVQFLGEHREYSGFFVYSDEKGNFRTWMSESLGELIDQSPSQGK
jgi:FAD:protein FMN transferase